MKFAYNITHHHSVLLPQIIQAIGCTKYLELGLYQGETFNAISSFVDYCVGVDTNPRFQPNKGIVYTGTTDQFFAQNKDTFDVIFIDADHSYNQVKIDFDNSVKVLNKFGLIFLHDTDPIDKKYIDPGYCGDSYKMVDYLYGLDIYEVLTLPVSEAGLTMVKRKLDRRIFV